MTGKPKSIYCYNFYNINDTGTSFTQRRLSIRKSGTVLTYRTLWIILSTSFYGQILKLFLLTCENVLYPNTVQTLVTPERN